jgi:hypothetical protein
VLDPAPVGGQLPGKPAPAGKRSSSSLS